MDDNHLRQQLHKLTPPEASEAVRGRARHRALIAFRQGGRVLPEKTGWKEWIVSWRSAVVLAFVVGLLPVLLPKYHPAPENLANDREILQQMEQLFPNQLNAVVERNGKVDLSIAESPVLGSGQSVLLVFKRGRDSIRVLSYSGHRVCVVLGKTTSCFEILATPTGGVILEGEDKAWLASEHPVVNGYSVRAQTLTASL